MIEENGAHESLTSGWRAVFKELPHAEWHPYAEHWLHTATDAGHRGDLLLNLLVSAADQCDDQRGTTFAALYTSARTAERTAPHGTARAATTTDRLLQKISTAQGLGQPAAPPPTTSTGGSTP
ncbi:hypothetical protein [Streptomyces sp. PU_AKi4]|uniref:hypothetical protein n=1 Tax=Streptomyces sp. PU_AKi4 TaxID=2800809 RepID=UPI0035238B56